MRKAEFNTSLNAIIYSLYFNLQLYNVLPYLGLLGGNHLKSLGSKVTAETPSWALRHNVVKSINGYWRQ